MKIGFLSLGCPKNLVDSEVMIGLLEQGGHQVTADAAGADVLVVNTCAFIDAAKEESIDAILEMAEHKRTGACRRLIVTGCLAERYRDELRREIPEIDVTLGTGEVPAITRAVENGTGGAAVPLRFLKAHPAGGATAPGDRPVPDYLYDAATPRRLTTPAHYAYLKIAEGCDYTCSFCIIPTLRGRYRSRPADSIVEEAARLAGRGVRELILISQDTTFYGNDRAERGALGGLLRRLNRVDGLEWIRLLYLYPTTITDDTLDAMAESPKVCRYVDLPLQHAAPDVLRRMRRPGNAAQYGRLLDRIRERLPGAAIRTTFIVGFPGESEDEFAELAAFVQAMRFDHVGVFTYSHEPGTRAHGLADDVPAAVKRERRRRLMSLQRRLVRRAHARRIGEPVQVRVDGPSADHAWVLQGRLAGHAPEIDPVVYLTECDPAAYGPGELISARITGSSGYDLVAAPLL